MQNAIDFRELRRRERQRIRSSKSKVSVNVDMNGVGGDATNILDREQDIKTTITPKPKELQNQSSLLPYTSLLPQNKISKETHRISTSVSQIDSVFYAQNFLSHTQTQEIISWLESIPEYSRQQHFGSNANVDKLSEREISLQHNGKWTKLKHARRKVALFDGTICTLPDILQRLSNTLVAVDAFPSSHPPNHVLINEYQPGEGIMPHTDGPAYERYVIGFVIV